MVIPRPNVTLINPNPSTQISSEKQFDSEEQQNSNEKEVPDSTIHPFFSASSRKELQSTPDGKGYSISMAGYRLSELFSDFILHRFSNEVNIIFATKKGKDGRLIPYKSER